MSILCSSPSTDARTLTWLLGGSGRRRGIVSSSNVAGDSWRALRSSTWYLERGCGSPNRLEGGAGVWRSAGTGTRPGAGDWSNVGNRLGRPAVLAGVVHPSSWANAHLWAPVARSGLDPIVRSDTWALAPSNGFTVYRSESAPSLPACSAPPYRWSAFIDSSSPGGSSAIVGSWSCARASSRSPSRSVTAGREVPVGLRGHQATCGPDVSSRPARPPGVADWSHRNPRLCAATHTDADLNIVQWTCHRQTVQGSPTGPAGHAPSADSLPTHVRQRPRSMRSGLE